MRRPSPASPTSPAGLLLDLDSASRSPVRGTVAGRWFLLLAGGLTAWFVGVGEAAAQGASQKFPDVVAAKVQPRGQDTFDFDVTVSSPYDTPERYADAFRVMNPDGTMYGERTLFHDHATEQPFTRDLYGVKVPRGTKAVVVQARDRRYGYGGKTVTAQLPGR